MPPKAPSGPGKVAENQPDWWDPQWAPRSVEYKLIVTATFHPSVGAASLALPWLDASGSLTAAPVTSGPFSSFVVDETKTSPNRRFPGAVTASVEKSLGSLAVSAQFIQALQKAVLPISIDLGTGDAPNAKDAKKGEAVSGDPNTKAGGVARLHPGPLLLANDGEDGDLPRRPSEVCASLTETTGFPGIYKLEVKVVTDIPVLSREMLDRLMPACICVDVVRGLPNELWLTTECEDVHVEVYPQVGANTKQIAEDYFRSKSIKRPHNTFVKFAEPTIWLLGSVPLHTAREWIQNEAIFVEVHDRDLRRTEDPPVITDDMDEEARAEAERKRKRIEDRIHPHGLARFKIAPLLASKNLTVGLRAEVFPNRGNNKKIRAETAVPLKPAELLGDNGREIIADASAVGKTEVAPEYLATGAVCTMNVTLAVPVPQARHIQAKEEAAESDEWTSKEQREGESNIWICDSPSKDDADAKQGSPGKGGKTQKRGSVEEPASPLSPRADIKAAPKKRCRAKVATSEEEVVHGPWRASKEEAESDEQHLLALLEKSGAEAHEVVSKAAEELKSTNSLGVDRRYERFGRVVIIADDNDTQTNKAVLECVKQLNAETLGINPDSAEMLIREFHDDEKANPHLDVLTGFSVLDGKCRLMVIEGLREHGLKRLLKAVPRDARRNDANFKMLHNPEVGFSERQYMDFGAKLYQLKVRVPIEKLAAKPEHYVVMAKINEDSLVGMKVPATLMAIKKMERLHHLREGTTFPKAAHVEQLNILFGDYLSDGMMEGNPVALENQKDAKMPMRQTFRRSIKGELETVNVLAQTAPHPQGRTLLPSSTLTHSQTTRNIMQKTGCLAEWPQGETEMKTQVLRDLPISVPDIPSPRPQLDHWNKSYGKTLRMRQTVSEPNLMSRNKERVKERSDANVHLNHILNKRQPRQTPFLDGQEVYLYSGQKHNCCEKQKVWMRESMSTEQAHTMYTYAPNYLSGTFEISEAGAESGKRVHQARCPTDTYARLPGDNRDVWRSTPARPKEEYRKPPRDLSAARGDELHEQFVDGEWFKLPIGDSRHKPVAVHIRYEPGKIPHHRRITERPFDRNQVSAKGQEFGPKSMNESVHYNAHGAPGHDRHANVEGENVRQRDEQKNKIVGERYMRTYAKSETRRGVTCTDREEPLLKDPSVKTWRGSGLDDKLPTTIRTFEPYHGAGNPAVEFQARMRDNDTSAPYDVSTGGYIKRDPDIGTKRAVLSGTLKRAPWRHEAAQQPAKPVHFEYVSNNDFDATRMPGKSIHDESHLWKNASRTILSSTEKSSPQFRRPKDFGIQIPVPAAGGLVSLT